MIDESTTGISVHGQGRMEVEPDIAELQLAVSRMAEAPAGAFEATRAAVGAFRTSLETSGISETAIQVSRLRLSAVYDYSNNRQRLTGHEASADITVAIKDVKLPIRSFLRRSMPVPTPFNRSSLIRRDEPNSKNPLDGPQLRTLCGRRPSSPTQPVSRLDTCCTWKRVVGTARHHLRARC